MNDRYYNPDIISSIAVRGDRKLYQWDMKPAAKAERMRGFFSLSHSSVSSRPRIPPGSDTLGKVEKK